MRHILIAIAAVVSVGCAASPPRPDLAASAGTAPAAEIDASFRQSLALRFGAGAGRDAVLGDLNQAGFTCSVRAPAIGAALDTVIDVCTRSRPAAKAGCLDQWSVDLRFKNLSRALDSTRVAPVGRFTRSCS
jgi:hypothetical protein